MSKLKVIKFSTKKILDFTNFLFWVKIGWEFPIFCTDIANMVSFLKTCGKYLLCQLINTKTVNIKINFEVKQRENRTVGLKIILRCIVKYFLKIMNSLPSESCQFFWKTNLTSFQCQIVFDFTNFRMPVFIWLNEQAHEFMVLIT